MLNMTAVIKRSMANMSAWQIIPLCKEKGCIRRSDQVSFSGASWNDPRSEVPRSTSACCRGSLFSSSCRPYSMAFSSILSGRA